MRQIQLYFTLLVIYGVLHKACAFWDMGTTTLGIIRTDTESVRTSWFRWQFVAFSDFWRFPWDYVELGRRRRLNVVVGISIDMLCLSTGILLNRRTVITAANFLDPYMDRPRDLRVWALGRTGKADTPYRYRVWRARRLFPKSLNPEHWHGPRGVHSPRHDVVIIHTLDQMYVMDYPPKRFMYPYRARMTKKHGMLGGPELFMTGSGYEYMEHVIENYKIFYTMMPKHFVVDCSKYLPKWWGKFICFINYARLVGVQNGGGLVDWDVVVGIGAFEIRYNEDRILCFTDLRYYHDAIFHYAHLVGEGEYYEYAYPEWGVKTGIFFDGWGSRPRIPWWIMKPYGPLGKK